MMNEQFSFVNRLGLRQTRNPTSEDVKLQHFP